MNSRKSLLLLFVVLFSSSVLYAQTTYMTPCGEEYYMIDRWETTNSSLSNVLFTTNKKYSRKDLTEFLEAQLVQNKSLSRIDKFNLTQLISKNGEWGELGNVSLNSKKPFLNTFYKKQSDAIQVDKKGFFLAVNPVLSFQYMHESKNPLSQDMLSCNQGIALRSRIADRVGLSFDLIHAIESPVSYVNDNVAAIDAIPGAGPYHRISQDAYNYLLLRGQLDFALIKDKINISAGYDKQFIGDGYRTLFLSDFSPSALFAGIRTKIWKLNYQNLYMRLVPQFNEFAVGAPDKYATIHHLSVNATRWLNVGLFEATTFSRRDHYDFSYLNPIILYRATERYLGSPDKVALGINTKAIVTRSVNVYGQFLLNEFTAKEFFGNKGYWANKWGVQLGLKYFNAFTVKNLDLQVEANWVRPFTYTHHDTLNNFTNYNQPMAHPYGAGFREFIGIVRYQPAERLLLSFKAIYSNRGVDSTAASNDGNNILLSYDTRSHQYGYNMIGGIQTNILYTNLNASYEFKPNFFFDLGLLTRNQTFADTRRFSDNNTMAVYLGFRINTARREYDFR